MIPCSSKSKLLIRTCKLTIEPSEGRKVEDSCGKSEGTAFHLNNVKPHTSIVSSKKLRELVWEFLCIHFIVGSWQHAGGYYLFLSTLYNYVGEKFASADYENRRSQFFTIRDMDFYERLYTNER